jgi:RNA polymerase sigma factor (sigma-70 family)
MPPQPWNAVVRQIRRLVGSAESDESTDRRLLEAFAARQDQAAFTQLVERHGQMVMNVCRRSLGSAHDAEDAFQAVFCVLARKAGSIQWQESVGSWLYGVAYRVACKAKVRAARRRAQERKVAAMRSAKPERCSDAPELDNLLDGELNRLPEKYRAPLVLCCLEGQTNEEAARLLGWPKGTVQGRLARGRELLRTRLARRGLVLSAASFTVAGAEAVSATVLASLIPTTIQTALRFAAGPAAAAEPVAGSIAVLAEGVLRTMWWNKVKIVGLMLLVIGMASGLAAVAHQALSGSQAVATPLPDNAPRQGAHAVATIGGGIMIDKDDNAIYVVNTDSGIDALELKTGKLLWKSAKGETYWPLAIVDKRLIARTRDDKVKEGVIPVYIAVLDITQNGKPLMKSDSVAPPLGGYDWLDTRVVGGANIPRPVHTFHAEQHVVKDELVIQWKSHSEIPNFALGLRDQQREVRDESGTVHVNLETGKVKLTPGEKSSKQVKGGPSPKPVIDGVPSDKVQVGEIELSVEGKRSLEGGAFTKTSRTLKAVDKQTGRVVWEHPLKAASVGFAP